MTVRARDGHRVLRCRDCDFLTLKTGIDEAKLADSYQDYLPSDSREIAGWEREQRPVIDRAVREIGRRARGKSLLEIGAGFGFFLARARAAGFEVQGLEFSATGRRHAREQLRLELRDAPFERAELPAASFDVVCAFYVIEHLPDPAAFLREAARVLKPGGLLFLRWPHSTPLARLLDAIGIDHDLYHAPWHLSDFSPATIERALRSSDFGEVTTRTFGGTNGAGLGATLLSRGAAACSDLLEVASGGRLRLPGVSKTTFGIKGA